MIGTTETTFSPNDTVKKSSASVALSAIMYAGNDNSNNNGLVDISVGKYYAGAAVWADVNGIMPATSNGYFYPQTVLTREKACIYIYNLCNEFGIDL